MKKTSTVLAMALLALAGCASDSSMSTGAGNGAMSSTSGSSSSGSSMAESSASGAGSATPGASASQAPSMGVVQTIDQITRQDAMSMGLATGAAAAGGAMGAPTDKVYRITLRLDDGTTQTVLSESMPGYKSGDRVRYANGMVQRESQ